MEARNELRKDTPVQSDNGPSNLNSFSTVAIGRHGYEAALLTKSIRLNSNKKIHMVVDEEALRCLENDLPNNASITVLTEKDKRDREKEYTPHPNGVWPECPRLNKEWWSPSAQSYKMDVMSKAIKESGNTLFMDADVILVNPVEGDFNSSLVLSKHKAVCGGAYIYSDDPAFPEDWRNLYKSELAMDIKDGGGSYSCGKCSDIPMTKLKGDRSYSLFSKAHNYGPWNAPVPHLGARPDLIAASMGFEASDDIYIYPVTRKGVDRKGRKEKMVSFHVHLRPKNDQAEEAYNLQGTLYECLIKSAKEAHGKLMEFICETYIPGAIRLKLNEA
tara:strand:+ start:308 stop:1300 length:993 start_codon:yes stop_codon:yes gene_type:complete